MKMKKIIKAVNTFDVSQKEMDIICGIEVVLTYPMAINSENVRWAMGQDLGIKEAGHSTINKYLKKYYSIKPKELDFHDFFPFIVKFANLKD